MSLPVGPSVRVAALAVLLALPTQAQVIVPRRVAVAPVIATPIAPPGVVSVAEPRYRFPRLRAAAQRRLGIVPPLPQPEPAPQDQPPRRGGDAPDANRRRSADAEAAPTLAAPPTDAAAELLPDESDLRAMDDAALLNTLVDVSGRLNQSLSRLTTGAGWQRYLELSEDALPQPSRDGEVRLKMSKFSEMLDRFDRVAHEKDYAMIAKMPSFEAMHATLRHLVERFDQQTAVEGPLLTSPTQPRIQGTVNYESLPAPEPESADDEQSSGEERSVLKRTTRS